MHIILYLSIISENADISMHMDKIKLVSEVNYPKVLGLYEPNQA